MCRSKKNECFSKLNLEKNDINLLKNMFQRMFQNIIANFTQHFISLYGFINKFIAKYLAFFNWNYILVLQRILNLSMKLCNQSVCNIQFNVYLLLVKNYAIHSKSNLSQIYSECCKSYKFKHSYKKCYSTLPYVRNITVKFQEI